jgi:L-lactate dehydrogenase
MKQSIVISIAGFGYVGSTIAWSLLNDSSVNWAINIMEPSPKQEGKILDYLHATPLHSLKKITVNNTQQFLNSDYIIHAAGGSTNILEDRMELLKDSIATTKDIFYNTHFINKNLKIIVVSNPVDIISWYTHLYSGLNSKNIIGTGTSLDSYRLAYYIAKELGIHPSTVSAKVLGEHGKSMVPLYSNVLVEGKIYNSKLLNINILTKQTLNAAFEIKKTQPATYFGVSACVMHILHALILPGEVPVLPLSVQVNSYYKELLNLEKNIFLGLPVQLSSTGNDLKLVELKFTKNELDQLRISAHRLQELVR